MRQGNELYINSGVCIPFSFALIYNMSGQYCNNSMLNSILHIDRMPCVWVCVSESVCVCVYRLYVHVCGMFVLHK